MTVTREATGRPFATKYATSVFGADRDTIDEAYPGDVIGLVNAADLRIGDTLYAAEPVAYPADPHLRPRAVLPGPSEGHLPLQAVPPRADPARGGGRHPGAAGRPDRRRPAPILAAVGAMQFEVVAHRLEHEYGAATELTSTPYKLARRTDAATAAQLRGLPGVRVMTRTDGTLFALFETRYRLERLQSDHPDWVLATTVWDRAAKLDAPHGGDVAGVGAAAAADEGQVRQLRAQRVLRRGQLDRVALVELGGRVELRVAEGRRVRPEPDDARAPVAGVGQPGGDVGGVGAVDHEVVGAALGVDLGDGGRQRRAVRQPAVLLDGEGDRDRQAGGPGGADDADRLAGAGEGERP